MEDVGRWHLKLFVGREVCGEQTAPDGALPNPSVVCGPQGAPAQVWAQIDAGVMLISSYAR